MKRLTDLRSIVGTVANNDPVIKMCSGLWIRISSSGGNLKWIIDSVHNIKKGLD